jgi:hypothetical protein
MTPGGAFSAPFAVFHYHDPQEQTSCGRLAEDAPDGYRVYYDEYFRVSRVLRYAGGREAERWETTYAKDGLSRQTLHMRGQARLDLSEYGKNGRIMRFSRYQGTREIDEYVYNQSGQLMIIKVFRGGVLERVNEVRYHPSGLPFMHLVRNGGNAIIGRTVFETDTEGRVLSEQAFLWGRLTNTALCASCDHGYIIARTEHFPKPSEVIADPFYVAHKSPPAR